MEGLDFESLKKELYTAVLSDILDEIGLNKQALRTFVRPIDDTLMLFGRARTGLFVETYFVREGENPSERDQVDRRSETGRYPGAGLQWPHQPHCPPGESC